MTANQLRLALAQGIGMAALVAGVSMALHAPRIWPGVLIAFGLPVLGATLGAFLRGGNR